MAKQQWYDLCSSVKENSGVGLFFSPMRPGLVHYPVAVIRPGFLIKALPCTQKVLKGFNLIVAVHQPQYLPWLGYFDKIRQADVFCYLDNVQYKKNDWQNRNRIKTSQGWQWITVPVSYQFPQKIYEVKINPTEKWPKKHLQALVTNYRKAPFYKQFIDVYEQIYSEEWEYISDLNIYFIECVKQSLGLDQKPAIKSSQLKLREDPTDRLIDICKAVKADTYLSGQDGVKYMDLERFKKSSIEVIFQDFKHPVYPQMFNGFTSHMSVVDLLFNCGPRSLEKIVDANCN